MRLLFVASDPMEFSGILNAMNSTRPFGLALDWARAGRLGEHQALLTANGAGARQAAQAVDQAAPAFSPDAVISTGFCGALDPQLSVGDLVVANCIASAARRYAAQPFTRLSRSGAVIASTDHVVGTAAEKQALRATGAAAVEMEAAGIAARAEMLGLPFFCVRGVTDLATEDMANDFNLALRNDGHFDTIVIFSHALRRPATRLPELIRLRQNCKRAARTLGDFFVDCPI